ncbi:hypothetical protein CGJ01_24270, partial [Vibrio parahaemolyticus]
RRCETPLVVVVEYAQDEPLGRPSAGPQLPGQEARLQALRAEAQHEESQNDQPLRIGSRLHDDDEPELLPS